ncbi:aromatic acid exporter family protein [Paenibacillus sp. HB172176]|uniref:FUSC family protein n=1 Tax=Paenibacillus sp. HB172176 TaxID=2493690 RepID=UPI00143B1284|nr:aromatic acid exporter family protein [Paenibacillus sp. HB172176]
MQQLRIGKRLIKTVVAVYATAQICDWLGWPMIFAVIAAIVSMEPTVSASIKKGVVRLPSAAIGAAFAMLFDALLGVQPLTFTLSALATIYVCYRLGWTDTIVVATLTAVNMIYVTEAHFLIQFCIRLGTTATGIIVAALVNYFVFRPNYAKEIKSLVQQATPYIVRRARELTEAASNARDLHHPDVSVKWTKQAQVFLAFQLSDYRYRRASFAELREIAEARKCLQCLQRMQFYMKYMSESADAMERQRCRESLTALMNSFDHLHASTSQPKSALSYN